MSDFAPSENPTHPLGWAFLGAGAAAWLLPIARLAGLDFGAVLPKDAALQLTALVVGASAIGILLERVLAPLEKLLLRIANFGLAQPSEAWAAAWQTRWRYPVADSEFRRHEALASFGRVYLVHSLVGGALWAWVLCRSGSTLTALAVLATGLSLAFVCYKLWRQHSFLILRLVQITAAWKRDNALP